MLRHLTIKTLLMILFTLSMSSIALANKVVKVKGVKVYVKLTSQDAKPGDIFYLVDQSGKKRGLIRLAKIKGQNAIAKRLKGKAQTGWSLQVRTSKKNNRSAKAQPKKVEKRAPEVSGRSYWGFILGFAMDKMAANIVLQDGSTQVTNMSGNGFSAKGLFDYGLWKQVWFRGQLGIENFVAASSDAICGDSNDTVCEVNLSYFSLDLWGRYLFSNSNARPWVGVGFDVLFPSSKESTAIQEDSITSTSIFAVGGGLDWFITPTMYIPIQVEYGLFPSSADVTANYIALRAGLAFPF